MPVETILGSECIGDSLVKINSNFAALDTIYSAVSSTLENRFADVVNVKDFGAIGDGVADDTEAIQAAINAVNSRGGGIVYLPKPLSFYAVKQTFTVGSKTSIMGDGPDSTHIKWVSLPDATPSFANQTSGQFGRRGFINKDYVNGNSYITIEGIKLDLSLITGMFANNSRQTIYFYNCDKTTVKNCQVLTDGALVCNVRTTNYMVCDNYYEHTGTYASADGVIDQWDGSQNGTIVNNILECKNLTRWAILITATATLGDPSIRPCQNFYIANNKIKQSGFAAFSGMGRIDGCFNIIFTGNNIDGNKSDLFEYGAIDIRACENVVISNNIIKNTTKLGLHFGGEGTPGFYPYENNYNINIIGNVFENISTSVSFNAIKFSSPIVDRINIVGNIVNGGAYNFAIDIASGVVFTNYTIQNNYFKPGQTGIANKTNSQGGSPLFDINLTDRLSGSESATLGVINNIPNTKTTLYFINNGFNFLNNSGNPFFLLTTTPTAENRVQIQGTDIGVGPLISAEGLTDSNIDLRLKGKGLGNLRFGTHVANADAPISGYIQIKDLAGNIRKLAVIS